jgi:AraC-like DNA-binding protein
MAAHWVRQQFTKHFHDAYTIGLNEDGRGIFDCRGAPREAFPGTLSLIEPGEIHTGRAVAREGWIYRNFYIDTRTMTTLMHMAECAGEMAFRASLAVDTHTVRVFGAAFDALADPTTSPLEQESHLVLVIRQLCRRYTTSGATPSLRNARDQVVVHRLQEYLEGHPHRQVSLAELARLVQRSAFAVIRAFQRETGLPPHAYHNILRINHAKRMLREGRSIVETAVACGFCDQSHMYRLFRRVNGLPPGQYQASAISSKTLH